MTKPKITLARVGEAIADVAPTVAGALGGPLAGAAADALRRVVLGDEAGGEGGDDALAEAVAARDPQTLLALRRAEHEFRRAVLDARVEAERVHANDRDSARAREVAVRDRTPALLGGAVIAGFFAALALMLWRELPSGTEPAHAIMLGALSTMTGAVVNYYFGSSAGSKAKDKLFAGR